LALIVKMLAAVATALRYIQHASDSLGIFVVIVNSSDGESTDGLYELL
jgi:hypothetical protein